MAKVNKVNLAASLANGLPKEHKLLQMLSSLFEWQVAALTGDFRYAGIMAHRGCGKTALIVMRAALLALQNKRVEKRVLMPDVQIMILGPEKGETIAMYGPQLESILDGFIVEKSLDPRTSISYIKLINGATIRIDGLSAIEGEVRSSGGKEAESLRGKSIDHMMIDEIGIIDIQPSMAALLPTLLRYETKGTLMVFGTPKSKDSGFFWLWDKWLPANGGKRIKIPLGHELSPFTKAQYEDATRMYSTVPGVWESEYMLEFKTNDVASVYGLTIDRMISDGRIIEDDTIVHNDPTFVALDLGFNDDTALILYQVDMDGNPKIIDYYVNNRQPIETYLDWIASWSTMVNLKYVYLPHDSNAQVIGRQFTIAEQFAKALRPLNIRVGILKKSPRVAYEIPIVKTILGKTKVLKRCIPMLDKLREYSYEPSKLAIGEYTDIPKARQDDHVADAIRYFAMSYNSRYADLTNENKLEYAERGLINSEYLSTTEANLQQYLKRREQKPQQAFRIRHPIKIMR